MPSYEGMTVSVLIGDTPLPETRLTGLRLNVGRGRLEVVSHIVGEHGKQFSVTCADEVLPRSASLCIFKVNGWEIGRRVIGPYDPRKRVRFAHVGPQAHEVNFSGITFVFGLYDKKGTFTVIIRPVHIIRRDMYRLNSTNKKGLVGKFHSRARNWDRPIVTYRHYGKICCGNLDLVRAGDDYVDFVIHYTVSGPQEDLSRASLSEQVAASAPQLPPANHQASMASAAEQVSGEDLDDPMDGLTPVEIPGDDHQDAPRLSARYGELRSRILDEDRDHEHKGGLISLNSHDLYHMLDARLDCLLEMADMLRTVDGLRPDVSTSPDEDYRWSQEIYGVMGRISVTLARLGRCLRKIRSQKSDRQNMIAQMSCVSIGPESEAVGRIPAIDVSVKQERLVEAAVITARVKRRREEEIRELQDEHTRLQQIRMLLQKEQYVKERIERKKRKLARAEAATNVID